MRLTSSALPSSEAFRANRDAHLEALREVEEAAVAAAEGGGQAARERHKARGKMSPRARVAGLLDPGSPFLEVGATAAHGLYDGAAPCAGVIAGVGRVMGRDCMIVCNDATVKGGTYYPTCHASTSSIRVVRTCPTRTRYSPTATISGASSTTRRR